MNGSRRLSRSQAIGSKVTNENSDVQLIACTFSHFDINLCNMVTIVYEIATTIDVYHSSR